MSVSSKNCSKTLFQYSLTKFTYFLLLNMGIEVPFEKECREICKHPWHLSCLFRQCNDLVCVRNEEKWVPVSSFSSQFCIWRPINLYPDLKGWDVERIEKYLVFLRDERLQQNLLLLIHQLQLLFQKWVLWVSANLDYSKTIACKTNTWYSENERHLNWWMGFFGRMEFVLLKFMNLNINKTLFENKKGDSRGTVCHLQFNNLKQLKPCTVKQ